MLLFVSAKLSGRRSEIRDLTFRLTEVQDRREQKQGEDPVRGRHPPPLLLDPSLGKSTGIRNKAEHEWSSAPCRIHTGGSNVDPELM